MTIAVGDRLPEATFFVMTPDGPAKRTTQEIFGGRKVVLFAVPGAFTPTCHMNHLPGFVQHGDAIRAKGIDAILVTSVNDVFVMDAWRKASGCGDAIEFLADGNGDFAKAIGMNVDGSAQGRGIRSLRYSLVVEDGVVRMLNVGDKPGEAQISGAENLLAQL